MEKISKIIPASTRKVWVSGEVPKPRRTTEPNQVASETAAPPVREAFSSPVTPSTEKVVSSDARVIGTQVDVTA